MGIIKNAKEKAKKEKTVSGKLVEVNDKNLHKDLKEYTKLQAEINEKQAQLNIHYNNIKTSAKDFLVKEYNKTKSFPGTLQVNVSNGKEKPIGFQFITSDKYAALDEDTFKEMKKSYGDKLVEEKTSYLFDNKLLEKHINVIEKMFEKEKSIPEDDKENLIKAKSSYNVTKGSVKKILEKSFLKSKSPKVDEVIDDINPTFSIKSVNEIE